jgi:hypothetical protein
VKRSTILPTTRAVTHTVRVCALAALRCTAPHVHAHGAATSSSRFPKIVLLQPDALSVQRQDKTKLRVGNGFDVRKF